MHLQCDPVINCRLKALDFIELSIISLSLLFSSEPVNDALWLNAARACMWRLPDRAEMSWKRRHHGRDSKLRSHRWQDLWRRSIPDGERSVLPTRRLQNYVTKVTFSFLALVCRGFQCLKNALFQKWLNLQYSAFSLRNFGISEISNAEQHFMLHISKVKLNVGQVCLEGHVRYIWTCRSCDPGCWAFCKSSHCFVFSICFSRA